MFLWSEITLLASLYFSLSKNIYGKKLGNEAQKKDTWHTLRKDQKIRVTPGNQFPNEKV